MNTFEKPAILVVAAHMHDFLWRAGGTIAKYAAEGSRIKIIVLSDGARGEANYYWKQESATEEECHRLKEEDGIRSAMMLGVKDLEMWGLPDYPMTIPDEYIEKLAHILREFRPNVILTHSAYDHFNQDHNMTHQLVRRVCTTGSAAGFRDGLPVTVRQIPIFGFEPHMTEISDYKPTVYVDITDVYETKLEAMKSIRTQPNMGEIYTRKAQIRGGEASNRGSRPGCKYAECFEVYQPIAASGGLVW